MLTTIILSDTDKILADAQLSPVQQQRLVAWLMEAKPLPGERDLADRAAGLFAELGRCAAAQ